MYVCVRESAHIREDKREVREYVHTLSRPVRASGRIHMCDIHTYSFALCVRELTCVCV